MSNYPTEVTDTRLGVVEIDVKYLSNVSAGLVTQTLTNSVTSVSYNSMADDAHPLGYVNGACTAHRVTNVDTLG